MREEVGGEDNEGKKSQERKALDEMGTVSTKEKR